jgi:hypothetical protein
MSEGIPKFEAHKPELMEVIDTSIGGWATPKVKLPGGGEIWISNPNHFPQELDEAEDKQVGGKTVRSASLKEDEVVKMIKDCGDVHTPKGGHEEEVKGWLDAHGLRYEVYDAGEHSDIVELIIQP